ncbi:nucleotide exchange factor GrpE [Gordonia sp. MP11Mi]|uniref:Protein GrpE n=1 Tax=Gordonia sp. MP11Mi TaxID=3022769 RepID=A0AA97CVQ5_9ACTN
MTSPETGSPEPDEFVEEVVDVTVDETADAETAADAAAAPADAAPEAQQVTELTEALQRERAQFANFRRRSAEEALQSVARGKQVLVEKLLPILDDLDRAREHGDLDEGPLRAFADKLTGILEGEQLVKFGEAGAAFDPEIHEAIQHEGSSDSPVVGLVYRAGYRLGDKVIRTATVTVTDPA